MNRRPQPPSISLCIGLLLAGLAPACASMQQRVTESENRSTTLEAQVTDLQATQQNIIERLSALRVDLEAALDPIRAQQAGGGADLRALETEVAALREQVRLLTDALAAAQQQSAAPPGSSGGGAAAQPSGTTSAESEEGSLFSSAYADYAAGQYIVAVSGFEEFLVRYPGSSRAADALYWIGESLAAQNLHGEARRRFLDITQRYPASAKVPDAVLRAALEAIELGQRDDAVRELRQLVAAHAGSDAALIGCLQLDRLGQTLPAGCQIP